MTLIDDSYNANPSSMEAALKELIRMRGSGRTVAVLGDMLELGEFSEKAHSDIMEMVFGMSINVFVGVGEMMSFAAEKRKKMKGEEALPTIYSFKDVNEASRDIIDILRDGDTVLVKGSRAIGMEKIVERIKGL
jgi:UDP-N-acetylmuramoyl-tripeptide--D-alanyl-D-alanine ligase